MPKNNVTRKTLTKERKESQNLVTSMYDFFALGSEQSLRTYFGRVVKGSNQLVDTPFAKGEETPELLESWNKILVSIDREWPTLYKFEMDMAEKVGPLSFMKPLKDRIIDIEDYYSGIHLPAEPIDERAIKAALIDWKPAFGLRERDIRTTLQRMKLSTNSGSPYFTKRRSVIKSTIPFEIFHDSVFTYQALPNFNGKACAVLGWRGQEGGPSKDDVKQRVVWMFPFAVNIAELQVYQPLIEAAQKFNVVPAWVSMEAVDKRITELFDTKDSNDLVICTDFTKFDQHFNQMLQDVARVQLEHIMSDGSEWLRNIFPIKYDIPMCYNFISGKLQLLTGRHGMASGSGGTNADETLAHRALQFEAAIKQGKKLNPSSQCLGDDGILTYPGCTVDDVVEAYSKHGLEMNTSKQYASSQDCVYLRRWHHTNYRINGICAGVYSTMRALGRLRYMERFMDPDEWGPKAVALRQLSILENVKYHPLRDQFAEFCMKRDKYRLGIDIPGFLDNLPAEVRESTSNMPDFLGYTKTLQSEGDPTYGIENWWIVKYLKSKA